MFIVTEYAALTVTLTLSLHSGVMGFTYCLTEMNIYLTKVNLAKGSGDMEHFYTPQNNQRTKILECEYN